MNPTKLHASLVRLGKEKARTQAYHTTTDRLRKQIRAGLMVEFINGGNSIGKSESMALTHPDYIQACQRSEQAEYEAGAAAIEYKSAEASFDAWRTMEATKRAEMGLR